MKKNINFKIPKRLYQIINKFKTVFNQKENINKQNSYIQKIVELENELKQYKVCVPTGHFYSPYPDINNIKKNEEKIFHSSPHSLPGIKLNKTKQISLLHKFSKYYKDIPFKQNKVPALRYWFDNEAYQYSDAICLYSMIRYLRPKKIIEVGSGYSSCVTLDTNEYFFKNKIDCTFIEPYPNLLFSLLKKGDKKRISVISDNIQNVDLSIFKSLSKNDILFIDSTHVSKTDSDVNYIFFKILPCLSPGVHIHFHDVIYPFEYWSDLIYKGISWNEAYLLRAFLQYNNSFEIAFYNTFLEKFCPKLFLKKMPLCMKHLGGSIWIKKVK